jgi:hypothetical protein
MQLVTHIPPGSQPLHTIYHLCIQATVASQLLTTL